MKQVTMNVRSVKEKLLLALGMLLFMSFSGVFAQNITVTGMVTENTTPLAGVSVQVKGTASGTVTGNDGKYTISIDRNGTLVFSYVGYGTQEVAVGGRTTVDVRLIASSAASLNDVVVIGYGTANKRDLTGSIASIKAKDIGDRPNTNPVASIQGKIPGVYIVNSGRPGQEPDIRIRGTNSINGFKPLYVVDGIFNDNINFLNPADIESMEILKDPSSLAIFGVRGANGVIIVTTKKARSGQTLINVNSSVGIKRVTDRIAVTNAADFKTLYEEQLRNQAADAGTPYTPYNYANWQGNTDWQDLIFQNAILNYNNISITSATEKNRIYMGVGLINEEGLIKYEKLNKITININDELQVSKALKFGATFNGYRAQTPQERSVGGAIIAAPIAEAYNAAAGAYNTLPNFQRAQVNNPYGFLEQTKNTQINMEYRAVGSLYGELNLFSHLTARASFFADHGFNTSRSYTPYVVFYNPDITGSNKIDTASGYNRTAVAQSQNKYTKIQQDYLLTYKNKWGRHDLTVLGGFTTNYNSYEATSASGKAGSIAIPNNERYWYVSTAGGIIENGTQLGSGSAWDNSTMSYLARALYNFGGKYMLNGSFRRDGASAFSGINNKWQNFGSVGAAWVMSNENFFKDQNVINYLKLKGSWGTLGSQNIDASVGNYPTYPTLSGANSGVFGGNIVTALVPTYYVDPNLHWERSNSYEFGLELNTLQNKLHIEANYYNKKTEGFIALLTGGNAALPQLTNIGSMRNRGIELLATYNGSIGKDWSYSISGNFTTMNNKVLETYTGYTVFDGVSRTEAGYPVGYFYGYVANGIYQTAEEIKQSPVSDIAVKPGDIKFKDINGDGKITTADRTMIGNPTPDYTYGGSVNISFKGFDLGVDVMGVYGNEVIRNWNRSTFAQFNYLTGRLGRWNGVGTSNWEPIVSNSRSANNNLVSSYYIEDGSFFRIRNLQLAYNINSAVLAKAHIKSLRVFVNAQNLKTWKHNTGYTPEFSGSAISFGVDNGSYPLPVVYTFGVNLNL
jgi:TonB-linked SusC/RagA family outer membrane protein